MENKATLTAAAETPLVIDPARDVLRPDNLPLDAMFKPKSVALVGATERTGSVGRMVLSNLISSRHSRLQEPGRPSRGP